MRTSFAFLAGAAVIAAVAATMLRPAVPTLYPRFRGVASPPLSVEQALASFHFAEPGLSIRCVSHEPDVQAPVAAQFDERGRLWVVQMVTFMPDVQGTGELEKRNRISILEDTTGSGVFDKATVFMDDLVLPRAVAPCFDGALVLEPPNLLFCRSSTGDGRANERIVLLSGFEGLESPEHAGNGLIRGMDNWYHLSQHGVEFRIWMEGKTPRIETRRVPMAGQWGVAEDGAGRLFYTKNSNPVFMDLYPKHWGGLNPHAQTHGLDQDIMRDTACWPAHPTPGVNRGYQEHTLRPDGTLANLTAACGTMYFNDTRLFTEFGDSIFLGEAAGNLVKRVVFDPARNTCASAYKGVEFLASTDERFRPVNLLQTPDGAILLIDMYRGVIQHKVFITPFLKEQSVKRNLEAPLNTGRIYRIEPAGIAARRAEDLGHASVADLVAALAGNDWKAAQAQRLLTERQEKAAAALIRSRTLSPRALWTLDGLGELTAEDCARAPEAARSTALRLCVEHAKDAAFAASFRALAEKPKDAASVPLIAAGWAALGDDARLLAYLAGLKDNAAARSAALGFLTGREPAVLNLALQSRASRELQSFVDELFSCCLNMGPAERREALDRLASQPRDVQTRLLARVAGQMRLGSAFPRTMKLDAEPAAFIALPKDEDSKLEAIMARLEWPGHEVKAPPVRPLTEAEEARYGRGQFIYEACIGCHQREGTGSAGQAPALAASAFATGPADRAIRIVLHGLTGKYEVNGQKFDGAMPVPQVGSDQDIASVLTYIRRSFGNVADPIDANMVKAVREKYAKRYRSWTREELERSGGGAP